MSPAWKADVIVVTMSPSTLICLEKVLVFGGPELNKLIVVASSPADPALERLADGDPRPVVVIHDPDCPGRC